MKGTTEQTFQLRTSHLITIVIAAFFSIDVSVVTSLVSATELFVSTSGNDENPGTHEQPFATLLRARGEIRKRKSAGTLSGPVTVEVRGGVYWLSNGLQLEPEDSGTESVPIVWRAHRDETPVLVGGKTIRDFVPHQGQIVKADVAAQGFQDAAFSQLIFDGRRQILARNPNFAPENPYGGGWAYADGKPVPMYADVPGEDKHSFTYKPADARDWQRPDEVQVFVFPRYNWWNNICRVKSVDRGTRRITLAQDASYAIRPGDRYYFQNALEELDAPGEWYLDRSSGTLFFWPPSPLEGKTVAAPTTRSIVELGPGTSFVTLRGFQLECCEGSAVVLNQTSDCLVAGCTIRNVGGSSGSGVAINGGHRNGVVGCDICQTGGNAISISGGDRAALIPAGNFADNNYIHHTGVFYKQGVGIALNGVGNRASHNLIHDCPRFGILFNGNNLVIEYNHIRHVSLETADAGAVYTGGRDWLGSRGTVIRYNYFHDILGYGFENGRWVSPHFTWGVYLDDNAGGVDVTGNIVARAVRGLVHLHNGRDNRIENNIFVDGTLQQIECSGWTREHRYWQTHLPTMIQGYESVAKQPAWRSMRNMDVHPRDAVLPDGTIMSGNVFRHNIICYRGEPSSYVKVRNFSFAHNQFDQNVIWHYGQPVQTGQTTIGSNLSVNLSPNPGFEAGAAGSLPDDWRWQIRPTGDARAELVTDGAAGGRQALRIDAACNKEKSRDNYPIVVSRELELPLGRHYKLSAKMRGTRPGAKAKLMLQSYAAGAYFWASSPHDAAVESQWKYFEFIFRTPAQGERGWHAQMKTFRARVDFPDESGTLYVDDVSLYEVEAFDEWSSWQTLGMDRNSRIADPRFLDADRDDYRLQPDSPALELGFQPIPVEKIGPYQDDRRASWPIREASGAREMPPVILE